MYLALILVAVFFMAGCVGPSGSSQTPWSQVKSSLVGKTYADVVACAGIPESQADVGEKVGAVLYRDTITGGFSCDATLMIKEGRVVSITERNVAETYRTSVISPEKTWQDHTLCSRRFKSCPWAR